MMGSRQATGNMFQSLIKPLTPCTFIRLLSLSVRLYLIYIHIPTPATDAVLDDGMQRGSDCDA